MIDLWSLVWDGVKAFAFVAIVWSLASLAAAWLFSRGARALKSGR